MNGHSHVRSSFLGASITVPLHEGVPDLRRLATGGAQELDNGGRERGKVVIQLIRIIIQGWGKMKVQFLGGAEEVGRGYGAYHRGERRQHTHRVRPQS